MEQQNINILNTVFEVNTVFEEKSSSYLKFLKERLKNYITNQDEIDTKFNGKGLKEIFDKLSTSEQNKGEQQHKGILIKKKFIEFIADHKGITQDIYKNDNLDIIHDDLCVIFNSQGSDNYPNQSLLLYRKFKEDKSIVHKICTPSISTDDAGKQLNSNEEYKRFNTKKYADVYGEIIIR